MTSVLPIICRACVHQRIGADSEGCVAFPDGIPLHIIVGGTDHRMAHQGDHGIRFQQADGEAAAQAFRDWQSVFGDSSGVRR